MEFFFFFSVLDQIYILFPSFNLWGRPEKIEIYETFNGGAVEEISVLQPDTKWFTIWKTTVIQHITTARIFDPTLKRYVIYPLLTEYDELHCRCLWMVQQTDFANQNKEQTLQENDVGRPTSKEYQPFDYHQGRVPLARKFQIGPDAIEWNATIWSSYIE